MVVTTRKTARETAEKVLAAAGDAKNAILALGAGLLFVAAIAVIALVLAVRKGH